MINEQLKALLVPLADLKADPQNLRSHGKRNIESIKNSFETYGQNQPIVALEDGTVIVGNGRLQAARELGWDHLAVVRFKDRAAAQAYAIADNRSGELASWDSDRLTEALKDIKVEGYDPMKLGFSQVEIDKMLAASNANPYKSAGPSGTLAKRFMVPPFSVLDSKQGYWQDRKRALLEAMGETGQSREGALGHNSMLAFINNGVSLLDPVLAGVLLYWYTPGPCEVLDPFAGDLVFGWMAKAAGHDFTGIELRAEQSKLNQERCDLIKSDGGAHYITDTSENVDKYVKDETVDFLFSCPPYYDLEIYSDLDKDLSNQDSYNDFIELMDDILRKCVKKLKPNRFAALVVGEIRDKDGRYHGFVPDVIEIMTAAGMAFYNDLILLNAIGSAQFRANNLMKSRKAVKVHQNVLVFYKGDRKDIASHFGQIEIPAEEPAS